MFRHFVDLFDLTSQTAADLLDQAIAVKRDDREGRRPAYLAGRTLGLVFEKPSLRTRVSFEAAIAQLGGQAIFLPGKDVGLGIRESVADFARVISQYVDALAIRTFAQETVDELARYATIPVINALSDEAHPCQAMADLLTVRETFGALEGLKLVFVGDGNNVARSLALACALFQVEFVLACPAAYDFPEEFKTRFHESFPNIHLNVEHDANLAVRDADVLYTDVWASMGQEDEAEERRGVFAPYQVNDALMAQARPEAIFLHCLPAHRGEEVTDHVLDCERSMVIPQAANRLHFQKALLLWLLQDRVVETTPRQVTTPKLRTQA